MGAPLERASHQAFGAIESDFRPDRWSAQREQYKFTGKEEDLEVGLTYFGARYYHARLNRWISPDPLTIHGLGADLNPYAYVSGRALAAIDPFGLEGTSAGPSFETYTDTNGQTHTELWVPGAGDHFDTYDIGKIQADSSGLQVGPVEVPQVVIDHMMNSPAGQAAALVEQTERHGPQAIADAYKGGYRKTLNTVTGRFQLGTRFFGAPKTQAEVIGANLEEHLVTLGQRVGVGAIGAVAAAAEAGAVATAGARAAGGSYGVRVASGVRVGGSAGAGGARSIATSVPSAGRWGACKEFATSLQQKLQAAGISGARIDIQVGKGITPYSNSAGAPAERGLGHSAVRVGNTVFDNMRPGGIPYSESIADLGGNAFFDSPAVRVIVTPF